MPYSLKSKIKGLRYKGIITDKDCDRLCKALDNEGVLDKIRAGIEGYKSTIDNAISENELKIEGMKEAYADCLEIIDRYRVESGDEEWTI